MKNEKEASQEKEQKAPKAAASETKTRSKEELELIILRREIDGLTAERDDLLKKLSASEDLNRSLKIKGDYAAAGGEELYFDDFLKLSAGEKEIDFDHFKKKYPVMFKRETTKSSVSSPSFSEEKAPKHEGFELANDDDNSLHSPVRFEKGVFDPTAKKAKN